MEKTYGEYTLIEEDGEQVLKCYDEEYKMWVKLRFNENPDNDVIKLLKDTLKQQYISRVINESYS